jgi:hypothetical protein
MSNSKHDLQDIFNIAVCTAGSIYFSWGAIEAPNKALTILATVGATYSTSWLFNRFVKDKSDELAVEKTDPAILDDFIILENKLDQ